MPILPSCRLAERPKKFFFFPRRYFFLASPNVFVYCIPLHQQRRALAGALACVVVGLDEDAETAQRFLTFVVKDILELSDDHLEAFLPLAKVGAVQARPGLTPRVESACVSTQLLETTVVSSRWFQISACAPTLRCPTLWMR